MHCCGAPAEAVGMEEEGRTARRQVEEMARGLGADELIVACPSCQRNFDRPDFGLEVRSVWQLLAEAWSPEVTLQGLDVSVHDPCVARYDTATQNAVRLLIAGTGANTVEMEASGADHEVLRSWREDWWSGSPAFPYSGPAAGGRERPTRSSPIARDAGPL